MATELKIIDNVLLDCRTDAETVRIPKEVEYVSKHAFDSCEQVNIINLYPDYVSQTLSVYLTDGLRNVAKGWKSKLYTPCMLVSGIEPEVIDKAIDLAVEASKNECPNIEWGVCSIDADKIEGMMRAKERGYDVAALQNIPVAGSEGCGVLYVKGINQQNYKSLGWNFDYNLITSHLFMGYRISPRWLVVIESSKRLEGDPYSAFISSNCTMRGSREYLEYMEHIGRLVE